MPSGRKTRLTASLSKEISRLIPILFHVSLICDVVEIGTSTYYRWLKQGEADLEAGKDTPHARFAAETDKAWAEVEIALVAKVRAEPGGARYLLETLFPESWGENRISEEEWLSGAKVTPVLS